MPDRLSIHGPILVNTIGHCAGAIAFGILLCLLLIDWRRDQRERSILPTIAAGLAMLWNIGSLIGVATAQQGGAVSDAIVAASFSVLSILPAVLLHIFLGSRRRILWVTGYIVSVLAVALHVSDLVTGAPRYHYAALLLVTIGFGGLAGVSAIRDRGPRLAGAMVLFLFAISFVHFESTHAAGAWSGEIALHHAGIPLVLFVLLQDYRFLLLDAFIRFLVNGLLSAAAVLIALEAESQFGLLAHARQDPFEAGLIFTCACVLLGLLAMGRQGVQRLLTRLVFLRANTDEVVSELRQIHTAEPEYLSRAAATIAEFLSARRYELQASESEDCPPWDSPAWVRAVATFHFSRGDGQRLLLGSRAGGRRYLSEEIELLERLATVVSEQVERIRSAEMQALVAQAELRALQAQIDPHFLFNSLNALYGSITRDNAVARRMVSNLSDLFRHLFSSSRTMIPVEEEIAIVRAYLEIEALRLGPRLTTEIDVAEGAARAEIPVLSIQPLVENAIKHGVAPCPGSGFVRVQVRDEGDKVIVEVVNSGSFRESAKETGSGVGLANVRRRLDLCFGPPGNLEVGNSEDVTTVRFSFPVRAENAAAVSAH